MTKETSPPCAQLGDEPCVRPACDCPICGDVIEGEDGTFEGDVLYHYACLPVEEADDV